MPTTEKPGSGDPSNGLREEEKDDVSTSSHLDARIHILNHADAFGIYDQFGDFPAHAASAFGFFYKGCRYLSQLELRIENRRFIQLSSRIKSQNELMTIDLMNDEISSRHSGHIPKGVLLLSRAKFIFQGITYETVSITNFDHETHAFDLSFHFAADFKDIFEVRGMAREASGTCFGFEQMNEREIRSRYQGLDGIMREVRLSFSEQVAKSRNDACRVSLEIPPMAERVLSIEIAPRLGTDKLDRKTFADAQEALSLELSQRRDLFAQISTSNNHFNQWLDRSLVDIISLLAEKSDGLYPYAGVPWYNTVFGRDGLITAYLTLWVAPEISKGVLRHLANCQARTVDPYKDSEPGKILHEAREGEMADLREVPFKQYYGTIDATPLFVWLAGAYLRRTDDLDTIRGLWPNILFAMDWIREYGDQDRDGFVEYSRKGEQGLHNQGWKDSHDAIFHADGRLAEPPIALCEVQGYVYAALLSAANIARRLHQDEKAAAWVQQAEELKEKFNARFWIESLQTFALALDGHKQPCAVLSSNPGHCLLTGIVDEDKAVRLTQTLLSEDLSSRWGIRTLGKNENRFNPLSYHNGSIWPHDNAMIALGFSRYGQKEAARSVLSKLFDASLYFEGARLPELLCGLKNENGEGPVRYPVACSPQAWSVATVFGLMQAVVGIDLDAESKTLHIRHPMLPLGVDMLDLQNLWTAEGKFSVSMRNYMTDVGIHIKSKPGDWKILTWK